MGGLVIGRREQPSRGALTLHATGCRYIKRDAVLTRLRPSGVPQHIERPALRPLTVWTCSECLRRVAALQRIRVERL